MNTASKLPAATRRNAGRAWRIAATCALALALAACKGHGRSDVAGWLSSDPAKNHPITVERKETVLDIEVPPGSYGLTYSQKRDLHGFVRRFKSEDSGGVLVARVPSGGPNEIAARRAMDDVQRVARSAGVPRDGFVIESYSGGGYASAPIRVSFLRHVAQAPVCGDWSDNVARDPKNRPYRNLGCANQHNLAAMVANPRDLVEPRGTTPRSSERRDVVWDKYIHGEKTISEKSEEEKATVSDVSGGGK